MKIDEHTDAPPSPPQQPRVIKIALRLAEVISVAMFAALFLTFVAQVFWRYVLNAPLVWTLEVAGVLFVSVSLFTAATQMPLREHVSLDLIIDILPNGLRQVLITMSLLLFAVPMVLILPDTFASLEWMYRERTYAIDFNLGHLFVLMIFFVLASVARALWGIWQIWRVSDRDAKDS